MVAPALTREQIRYGCRRLDAGRHPLLRQASRDEVYDDGNGMAPGGLLLATMLADALALQPGARVLDLGCGRGQSSILLASRYEAQVTAVDLWIGAHERQQRAAVAGVNARITALQGDVQRGLPIQRGELDVIFCMQSFHCFGTQPWVLRYLASLLKPGGRLGIAQGCFREEADVLPPLFQDTDGWNAEYEKYHSPDWWRRHFASSGCFDVEMAEEVVDGDILWEDDVLYRGDKAGWSASYLANSAWLIRQVLHGRSTAPSLTHCIVVATRNHQPSSPRSARQ